MVHDKTIPSRIFDIVNYTLLLIIGLVTILPFLHVIAGSFTTVAELAQKRFVLFPTEWSLDAYRYIFSTNTIFKSLGVSVGVTFFGTMFSMLLTCLMAYGLSRKDLDGRNFIMFMVVFTMLFSGGMIPTFLVVKELGMIDTYAALIVPTAINAFNLIIMRNFFRTCPKVLRNLPKLTVPATGGFCSGLSFRCPCLRLQRFRCSMP